MGDNGHSGGADEELTLPRATVAKLINGEEHSRLELVGIEGEGHRELNASFFVPHSLNYVLLGCEERRSAAGHAVCARDSGLDH